jgi:hypothetical protein
MHSDVAKRAFWQVGCEVYALYLTSVTVTKYLREINLKGMISVHGPLAQLLLGL